MGRPPFFRNDFSENKPRNFTFLIRPTQKEYDDFTKNLDIMMSDNINIDFFSDEVELFEEREQNNVKYTSKRGSIAIFNEWIKANWVTSDYSQINDIISTFKKIRRERNKPSHKINDDKFDQKYFRNQRELIIEAYGAVSLIRQIFSKHPYAHNYEIPRTLKDTKIWTY